MIIICMILIVFFVYQIGVSLWKNQGEKVFIFLPLALLSYLPIYIFYKKNTPLKNHKKSQVLSFLVNFFMILWFYTIFKSFFD